MAVTIDGSSGISSVDGSAGSPSFSGTDSNSGIYYGSDLVRLSAGGSEKFQVNTDGAHCSGNLGLGDNNRIQLGGGDNCHFWFDGTNTNLNVVNGNLRVEEGGNERMELQSDGDLFIRADLRAWLNDSFDVGKPGHRWDDIYATNGSINTSDKNEKNTIVDSDLGLSFVNKLKPVSYKFNGKTRTHYGLIAQDIETTLSDISKSSTDFAGFIKTTITKDAYTQETLETPKTEYGLRYTEFIAPLIKAIQELSTEVETLKTKVAALEAA
mgnify:CR=1 FL=1